MDCAKRAAHPFSRLEAPLACRCLKPYPLASFHHNLAWPGGNRPGQYRRTHIHSTRQRLALTSQCHPGRNGAVYMLLPEPGRLYRKLQRPALSRRRWPMETCWVSLTCAIWESNPFPPWIIFPIRSTRPGAAPWPMISRKICERRWRLKCRTGAAGPGGANASNLHRPQAVEPPL